MESEGLMFQRFDGTNYVQHLFIDSTGNMSVGHTAPAAKLDVVGNIKADSIQLVGGTLGAGRVLTDVNGDGKASWQTPSTGTDSQTLSLSGSRNGTLNISNGNRVFLPDSSNTNELQNLGLFGSDSITISNGQGIDISHLATDNKVKQDSNAHAARINANASAIAADNDGSASNELQSIAFVGDSLTIDGRPGVRIQDLRDSSLTDLADTAAAIRSSIKWS